ncbi:putative cytochrome P450 [Aspergillus sclerotioniger CBS 115572]|uniref:Putative cytochrome P450 n=1 Tax=Aspergillus sclerotioniger CBS 115572 TaxID=1450535 RepID=A0A317WZ64_9EURO|nr:putative cytochrome P450 [Aspergillus sclerotioniger CBS 115572]PWY91666.1 putative cytochrome P450 [Aspergillus sclerotioniger CBS 115572]
MTPSMLPIAMADLRASLPWALVIAVVGYSIARILYNLFLHPLRHFPGPWWAACSHLHEFYFDVIQRGMFMWQIERMHQQYGPIVRINPREIHISDPTFYNEIYAGGSRRRDKDPYFTPAFSAPLSMVATNDHDHHRFRRSILNGFFSKRSVLQLEPMIQQKVDKLLSRFTAAHDDGDIIATEDAYAALTADVISFYSYGHSFNYLDHPTFNSNVRRGVNGMTHVVHFNRFFPVLLGVLRIIPLEVVRKVQPYAALVIDMRNTLKQMAASSVESRETKASRMTMFEAMNGDEIPAVERTIERLTDEAQILIAAGTETTARVLVILTYYLCLHQDILLRLRKELSKLGTDRPTWTDLENVPYLRAVINEGLRLSIGLTIRLPRIAPDEDLVYKNWVIPRGTPMSSSSYLIAMNPELFPNPKTFNPDRWLEAADKGENLTQYLTNFTKGSRSCVGIK